MDSRFRFLHHTELLDEAVTQKDRMSAVMVNRVGTSKRGSSKVHFPLRRGGSGTKVSREASDFTLARKAAKEAMCARTANRRRWAGREF